MFEVWTKGDWKSAGKAESSHAFIEWVKKTGFQEVWINSQEIVNDLSCNCMKCFNTGLQNQMMQES